MLGAWDMVVIMAAFINFRSCGTSTRARESGQQRRLNDRVVKERVAEAPVPPYKVG